MNRKRNSIAQFTVFVAAWLCFAGLPVSTGANSTQAGSSQTAAPVLSASEKKTVAAFDKRVKAYVKMRERIEGRMPKLSKDSTPEQIEAHKTALQESVRKVRNGHKPGNIFTKDIAAYIRKTIRSEFEGQERVELRQTVLEAETQGVPVRVNYPYPESKELVEMPPTLLLKLPPLPKQLRYRFVGRHMLLVDRENGLIIDYMPNAVP